MYMLMEHRKFCKNSWENDTKKEKGMGINYELRKVFICICEKHDVQIVSFG